MSGERGAEDSSSLAQETSTNTGEHNTPQQAQCQLNKEKPAVFADDENRDSENACKLILARISENPGPHFMSFFKN